MIPTLNTIHNSEPKKRVFVGLSGGVDSSVSAALLKDAGYDVVGVFIKVWQPEFLDCTWIDDRRDAMRVAAQLGIPFMTLDLENEYKTEVVDYMIKEYKDGRTPNPDVMCNKVIKFGAFYKKAIEMGADYVATGHYARTVSNSCEGKLLTGADKEKDQSYFLWMTPKENLNKIIFPVGIYQKSEVREIAVKFNLPTAKKKDSQGLCFMGKLDMKDFLKHFIPEKSGHVLDEQGNIIGHHDGAFYLTLGQRHGFTITRKGTNDSPMYIVGKDVENNTITVSQSPRGSRSTNLVKIKNINWIREPRRDEVLGARVRYRQPLEECSLSKEGDDWIVRFKNEAIFPAGQSLVVYSGEECLGGGIIGD